MERTDQALREVALAYDQVDTGPQQYDAAIALQTECDAAFHSASDAYVHASARLARRRRGGGSPPRAPQWLGPTRNR